MNILFPGNVDDRTLTGLESILFAGHFEFRCLPDFPSVFVSLTCNRSVLFMVTIRGCMKIRRHVHIPPARPRNGAEPLRNCSARPLAASGFAGKFHFVSYNTRTTLRGLMIFQAEGTWNDSMENWTALYRVLSRSLRASLHYDPRDASAKKFVYSVSWHSISITNILQISLLRKLPRHRRYFIAMQTLSPFS